jgi:GNAT superfamily N-acetyltransferase
VLKPMGGRLWPFGWVRLLFGKRCIDTLRVTALGVTEAYRGRGIDILLYAEICRNFLRCGYRTCEMSWILEDNAMMNRALQRIGAVVTKRYRLFEKTL